MKKIGLFLLLMFISMNTLNAWVYTGFHWDNGWGWLMSQEFELEAQESKLKFQIKAAENIKSGEWQYFLVYIVENTIGENQAWYPKGVELKIRDGNGSVYTCVTRSDKKWIPRKSHNLERNAIGSFAITGVNESTVYDPLEVYYPISVDELTQLAENGFVKIRTENNSKIRYHDYNFSEKETKASKKRFKKHLENLLNKRPEVEKKVVETRERWEKERLEREKLPKHEKQEIGEF